MKYYLSLLTALLLSPTTVAFDLSEAYHFAIQNDIQLKIETSNLASSKASFGQAVSALNPKVSTQVKGNIFNSSNSDTNDFSSQSASAAIIYSQSLYNLQASDGKKLSRASYQLAKYSLQSTQQDLIIRVAEAYFDILIAKDNLEFAQTEVKAIDRQLEQAKKRFEVGLTAITDVKEVQALYDSSIAQELDAQNQLDISLQSLFLITGVIEGDIATLNTKIKLKLPEPSNANYWVKTAIKNNVDALKAYATLLVADAQRKNSKHNDSMTVDASGSLGLTISDHSITGDNTATDASIGITLNIPLYTGGFSSSLIAEQEANYQGSKDAVLLQKKIAAQQARSLYLTIRSGLSQVKALAQASESSATALEATNAGFEVGTRTSVDVLASIKETYRSQKNESSARYQFLLNVLRLKANAGKINTSDIQSITSLLN